MAKRKQSKNGRVTALAKRTSRSNAAIIRRRKNVSAALAFFDMEAAGAALRARGFTPADRMTILVDLIESENEAVSLGALKEFRALMGELLETSGAKQRQSVTVGGEGRQATAERVVLERRLLEDPPAAPGQYNSTVYEPIERDDIRFVSEARPSASGAKARRAEYGDEAEIIEADYKES